MCGNGRREEREREMKSSLYSPVGKGNLEITREQEGGNDRPTEGGGCGLLCRHRGLF